MFLKTRWKVMLNTFYTHNLLFFNENLAIFSLFNYSAESIYKTINCTILWYETHIIDVMISVVCYRKAFLVDENRWMFSKYEYYEIVTVALIICIIGFSWHLKLIIYGDLNAVLL